jgi:hypothetical protein
MDISLTAGHQNSLKIWQSIRLSYDSIEDSDISMKVHFTMIEILKNEVVTSKYSGRLA